MFDLISNYLRNTKELSKKDKQAVNNIVTHALSQTRTFIARNRKSNDDVPSQILSTIWIGAANDLLQIENAILEPYAETLRQKSVYWSDPKSYDMELLKEYKMRLIEVEDKLEELRK